MLPATPLPVSPQATPPLPCFFFLSPSLTSKRGEHSWERWGSGSCLALSDAFHPTLQPPGFHRAYSSPLYSNQQYASVCK